MKIQADPPDSSVGEHGSSEMSITPATWVALALVGTGMAMGALMTVIVLVLVRVLLS